MNNKREGHGTFWVCEGTDAEGKKLRKIYTGNWVADMREVSIWQKQKNELNQQVCVSQASVLHECSIYCGKQLTFGDAAISKNRSLNTSVTMKKAAPVIMGAQPGIDRRHLSETGHFSTLSITCIHPSALHCIHVSIVSCATALCTAVCTICCSFRLLT